MVDDGGGDADCDGVGNDVHHGIGNSNVNDDAHDGDNVCDEATVIISLTFE